MKSFSIPGYPHSTIQVVWNKDFRKVDVFTVSPNNGKLHTVKVCSYWDGVTKFHTSDSCTDPPWLTTSYPSHPSRLAYLCLLSGGSGCHGQVRSEMAILGSSSTWEEVLDSLPGMFESCYVLG